MAGVVVVEPSNSVPSLERQLGCRSPLWHSGDSTLANSSSISAKHNNLGHFDHQVIARFMDGHDLVVRVDCPLRQFSQVVTRRRADNIAALQLLHYCTTAQPSWRCSQEELDPSVLVPC